MYWYYDCTSCVSAQALQVCSAGFARVQRWSCTYVALVLALQVYRLCGCAYAIVLWSLISMVMSFFQTEALPDRDAI